MKPTARRLSPLPLLVAAFALLSAAAGTGLAYGADVALLRAAQRWTSGWLDGVGSFLSTLGGLEVSGVLLLALAAGLFVRGRGRLAGRLVFAFLATGVLEYLLKQFLPVPPVPPDFVRAPDFAPVVTVEQKYPYPSGHALRSTILLGAVYLLGNNALLLRVAAVLVLLGLLWSRVYLGVHWGSDVLGGALLGVIAILWAFGKEPKEWR